jgi:hypothetical protein
MTTITPTKPKNRIQVAFNSTTAMDQRIDSLFSKYSGLSLSEIIKIAIIELDKSTEFEDETAYIKSDSVLYARLLKNQKKPLNKGVTFANIKELEDVIS